MMCVLEMPIWWPGAEGLSETPARAIVTRQVVRSDALNSGVQNSRSSGTSAKGLCDEGQPRCGRTLRQQISQDSRSAVGSNSAGPSTCGSREIWSRAVH